MTTATEEWKWIGGDLEASAEDRYVKIRVRGKKDYLFLSGEAMRNAMIMIERKVEEK